MDNQNDIFQQPSTQPTVEQPSPAHPNSSSHSKALLITFAFSILLFVSLTALLLGSRTKSTSKPPPSPVSSITSQPSPTPNPTANWKTFIDTNYSVEFKYPDVKVDTNYIGTQAWKYPPKITNIINESLWNCQDEKNMVTKEGFKSQKEQIIEGNKYCVTEISESAAGTDFHINRYSTYLKGKRVTLEIQYSLVDCGVFTDKLMVECNDKESTFVNSVPILMSQILSAFKFTDEEDQVVCAQDVKQCLDGSYVARQPPTCEFAKCPQK